MMEVDSDTKVTSGGEVECSALTMRGEDRGMLGASLSKFKFTSGGEEPLYTGA